MISPVRALGLLLLLGLSVGATRPADAAQLSRPVLQPVILASIDGFRADDLEVGLTPNLQALAERGVRTEMRTSLPTKTVPNHYTLVTGLRSPPTGSQPGRPGRAGVGIVPLVF